MLVSHCSKARLSKTALTGVAMFVSSALSINTAHAAGYQIAFDSASGLGRAYAGEAAIGDTAAAMGRNPAIMTLFERAEFSGALVYFDADIDVVGSSNAQSSSDTVPSNVVPASYYVQPLSEKLAVGLGLYSNYGLATELKDGFASPDIAGETSLLSVNLNPAIAYQITPMVSLGAGVSLIYATGEAKRENLLSWEGDDVAFGWNIGSLVTLDENNRFGLAYRAGVDVNLEGDFTDHTPGLVAVPGGGTVSSSSTVPLPATAEFSGFHQLNDNIAIHYSALWTQWSDYTEFKATGSGCSVTGGTCFLKPESYDDSWRWAIGTTYQLNDAVKLRAGFALDEKAGETTLSVPDQDAYWYSAGINYVHDANWSFDAGLAYMERSDETFTETSLFAGSNEYETKGYLIIAGVQANYRF
ncbi:outer membrane protein transport protein [Enterovibrio norvegicus]|uniref:outer membrane protein transport protein n=1 Tax=Enterovibrio norvegicus TaxID=188144 RepID=UPI000C826BD6|nr:outer membrane protein transport protein [Enterovibrio norvegicus]PML81303.1 long-chain fatty acid transporter [Enterovibrio norvegicus]